MQVTTTDVKRDPGSGSTGVVTIQKITTAKQFEAITSLSFRRDLVPDTDDAIQLAANIQWALHENKLPTAQPLMLGNVRFTTVPSIPCLTVIPPDFTMGENCEIASGFVVYTKGSLKKVSDADPKNCAAIQLSDYATLTSGNLFPTQEEMIKSMFSKQVEDYEQLLDSSNLSQKIDAWRNLGDLYSTSPFVQSRYAKKDNEKAFHYYKLAADKGDPVSSFIIGVMYLEGNAELPNSKDPIQSRYEKAIAYLTNANQPGGPQESAEMLKTASSKHTVHLLKKNTEDPPSLFLLGEFYYLGQHGVAQNKQTAAQYYEQASRLGSSLASYKLGQMQLTGDGVKPDYQCAAAYLFRAEDQGFDRAEILTLIKNSDVLDLYQLKRYLDYKIQILKDDQYLTSLDWGIPIDPTLDNEKKFSTAMLFLKGDGVMCRKTVALDLLRNLANQKYYPATYQLSQIYLSGKYVPFISVDQREGAIQLYTAACQGHPLAANDLLLLSIKELPFDQSKYHEEAFDKTGVSGRWAFDRAAEFMNKDKLIEDGLKHMNGSDNVTLNEDLAANYFRAAVKYKTINVVLRALKDKPHAQYLLGRAYWNIHDETQDHEKLYGWNNYETVIKHLNVCVQSAILCYQTAANNDNAKAQYTLYRIYGHPNGQEPSKAILSATEKHDSRLYYSKKYVAEADPKLAQKYFDKAVAQQHMKAMFEWGEKLMGQAKGIFWISDDDKYRQALSWYQQAADEGYAVAAYHYAMELKAAKNEERAWTYFGKAAKLGHEPSIKILKNRPDNIGKKLDDL